MSWKVYHFDIIFIIILKINLPMPPLPSCKIICTLYCQTMLIIISYPSSMCISARGSKCQTINGFKIKKQISSSEVSNKRDTILSHLYSILSVISSQYCNHTVTDFILRAVFIWLMSKISKSAQAIWNPRVTQIIFWWAVRPKVWNPYPSLKIFLPQKMAD